MRPATARNLSRSINGWTFWKGTIKSNGLFDGPPSQVHPIDDPEFEMKMKLKYNTEMKENGVDAIKRAKFSNPNTLGYTHPANKAAASRSVIYLKDGFTDTTVIHEFSHAKDYFNGNYAYNYNTYGERYADYVSEMYAYSASAKAHQISNNQPMMMYDFSRSFEYLRAITKYNLKLYIK